MSPCASKPALHDRPLIAQETAAQVTGVFKILANDTRLRLLHCLVRDGDLCVTELAELMGMKLQAVSNQLQRLTDRGILDFHRNGNQVRYRIIDPCVIALLDYGLCLSEDAAERRE